ncbi:MAG: hypothetical protein KJZ65_06615 [Phycisphaerales bacterium]|nr:hypothetical protein [Phycisphaerales bacterium]
MPNTPRGGQSEGLPEGWSRQALTVPHDLATRFKDLARETGPGAVKNLGTTAIALFLGLPKVVRDAIASEVHYHTWKSPPVGVDPDVVWRVLLDQLRKSIPEKDLREFDRITMGFWRDLSQCDWGNEKLAESKKKADEAAQQEKEAKWAITRILDPELTPPPGEKASDKAKRVANAAKDKGRKSG